MTKKNMESLIKINNQPFSNEEIIRIEDNLCKLKNHHERVESRNKISNDIAMLNYPHILIVSGPGTGKSTLFKKRLEYCLLQNPDSKAIVLTFVRKLINDLRESLLNTENLKKKDISAYTLHQIARSILEKNLGTNDYKYKKFIKIIDQYWKSIIWKDVQSLLTNVEDNIEWDIIENQFYDDSFDDDIIIKNSLKLYFKVTQFYNAVGFADLIYRAKTALNENNSLLEDSFYIIDEYQDFNRSEESFINKLLKKSLGTLIVGDDEQVLYDKLKRGMPSLIRNRYFSNNEFCKAMLPFCGRCGYHITKVASCFSKKHLLPDSIKKIFIPIKDKEDSKKVRIILCPTPTSTINFTINYLKDNKIDLVKRKTEIENKLSSDPFLLILSPVRDIFKYYNMKSNSKYDNFVDLFQSFKNQVIVDDNIIYDYLSVANNPYDNFSIRKVMFHENIKLEIIHDLVKKAISQNLNFVELHDSLVDDVIELCKKRKDEFDKEDEFSDEDFLQILEEQNIKELDNLSFDINKSVNSCDMISFVGAKGLSADNVLILGFDDHFNNRVNSNAFYVAMTRARDELTIVTTLKAKGSRNTHKFIDDIPEENIEYYYYNLSRGLQRLGNKYAYIQKIKRTTWMLE